MLRKRRERKRAEQWQGFPKSGEGPVEGGSEEALRGLPVLPPPSPVPPLPLRHDSLWEG